MGSLAVVELWCADGLQRTARGFWAGRQSDTAARVASGRGVGGISAAPSYGRPHALLAARQRD